MSATGSHEHLDVELVELLDDDAGPDRRRFLLGEVRRCHICRDPADELLAAAADVIEAVPAVPPALGFETRVASRARRHRVRPQPRDSAVTATPELGRRGVVGDGHRDRRRRIRGRRPREI